MLSDVSQLGFLGVNHSRKLVLGVTAGVFGVEPQIGFGAASHSSSGVRLLGHSFGVWC